MRNPDKSRCSKIIYNNSAFTGLHCSRYGIAQEPAIDGGAPLWWCRQHVPSNEPRRRQELHKEWDRKYAAENAVREKKQREVQLIHTKAAAADALYEATEDAIRDCDIGTASQVGLCFASREGTAT